MSKLLAVFTICIATAFLFFIIVWGTNLPSFNMGRFLMFYLPLSFFIVLLISRSAPLEFLLLTIVVFLPFMGFRIPPMRLGISVLNVLTIPVLFFLLYKKLSRVSNIDFFPVHFVWIPIVFVAPSVITAISPWTSVRSFLEILSYYVLFVAFHCCADKHDWPKKLILMLAVASIVASVSVIVERITGWNLSIIPHSGELSHIGSYEIKRSSGFFQDPQKAAQFIAVCFAFLGMLLSRKSLEGTKVRWIALCAVGIAIPALSLTAARAALFSGFAVIIAGFFLYSKFGLPTRFVIACALIGVVGLSVAGDVPVFQSIVPETVAKRTETTKRSLEKRWQIWRDSWHIFEENPITGIGPGNYKEYLMLEDHRLKRHYELGGYVPDMPESGYLKILYETGFIGIIGCLGFLVGITNLVLRTVKHRSDEPFKSIVIASSAGLLVFFATLVTIYTASDSRNAMIPILLLAFLTTDDST